jgi:hypothetical protein
VLDADYRIITDKSLKTSVWGHREFYKINIVKGIDHVDFEVTLNYFKERGNHMFIKFEALVIYDKH